MLWEVAVQRGIKYTELDALQEELSRRVSENPEKGFLLFSEPTPTYTCGRAGTEEDLLWKEERLSTEKIEIVRASRGGRWTYHGPGQVVVYPIVHLPTLGYSTKEVSRFMNDFRQAVAACLPKNAKIICGEEPFGLYSEGKKLASFGFRFKQGIANHGMALYLAPQQAAFQGIHPCGVMNQPLTSLEELGLRMTWMDLTGLLSESIKKGFNLPKK